MHLAAALFVIVVQSDWTILTLSCFVSVVRMKLASDGFLPSLKQKGVLSSPPKLTLCPESASDSSRSPRKPNSETTKKLDNANSAQPSSGRKAKPPESQPVADK